MLDSKLEELFVKYKLPLLTLLGGLVLIGAGIFLSKFSNTSATKVEIIEETTASDSANQNKKIRVEVSGNVEKPDVYEMEEDSRVIDAIQKAGGFTTNANTEWIDKHINKAAKLIDGQKIYIPSIDEQSEVLSATIAEGGSLYQSNTPNSSSSSMNVNTASKSQLEELWGIGPVTAQKIIEQRPYSNIEELLSKKIVKQNVYERIKNDITVF